MRRQLFERNHFARRLAHTASSAILAFSLCSCQTAGMSDITGSLGDKAETSSSNTPADPHRDIEVLGERFRADPKDVEAALAYGKALRAEGQRDQAVAVLQKASIANPGNKALLAGYGRALADNGDFQQAFDVLSRAHSPDNPDWRILSAQGAALDQLGRYDDARRYYESALKIEPDDPSVLSNLGLSYVLSKDLPKAEQTLRRAYGQPNADPRVRINLAFVVGLEGRMTEAEGIVKAGLSPEEGTAKVMYLHRLLARQDKGGRDNAHTEAKIPVASAAHDD